MHHSRAAANGSMDAAPSLWPKRGGNAAGPRLGDPAHVLEVRPVPHTHGMRIDGEGTGTTIKIQVPENVAPLRFLAGQLPA
eukprot:1326460-Amphidinium_carterae.1